MFEPEGRAAASDIEVKRRIGAAIASTAVSLAGIFICYYKPLGADAGMWFARFGAVITVLALLNESQLTEGISRLTNVLREKYLTILNALRVFGLVSAVVGTVIWGYGDLFINGLPT